MPSGCSGQRGCLPSGRIGCSPVGRLAARHLDLQESSWPTYYGEGSGDDTGADPPGRDACLRLHHNALPAAGDLALSPQPAARAHAGYGGLRRRRWPTVPAPCCGRACACCPIRACKSVYEEWATAVDVGGAFRARPAFAIDNAITQFDVAAPERVVFNKAFACGPMDAAWAGDSYCKGDKCMAPRPRWVVSNRGPLALPHRRLRAPRVQGSAPGGRSPAARQASARECCGVENAFVMERPSDGGMDPRRPWAELGELRVPGLLRDPRELGVTAGQRPGFDETP